MRGNDHTNGGHVSFYFEPLQTHDVKSVLSCFPIVMMLL